MIEKQATIPYQEVQIEEDDVFLYAIQQELDQWTKYRGLAFERIPESLQILTDLCSSEAEPQICGKYLRII